MIIDIHAHVGSSWLAWRDNKFGVDGLIKLYDKFKVDKGCISSWNIAYDPKAGTNEVYEAVQKYPNRLIGFANVCPRYGRKAVEEELDRSLRELGMKGIGEVHPSVSSWHVDSPIINPIMEKALEYRAPVLIHSWSNDVYSSPRAIGNLAARYPDVTVIMAHMGFEEWLDAIWVAKNHDNVLLDTTGVPNQVDVIEKAVEVLGAERIVWGSDTPGIKIGVELAKIEYADISSKEKAMILGENAARILKL